MSCNNIVGYVQVDEDGNPILSTFTLEDMSSSIGWEYIEIDCDDTPDIEPNSTTTQSSTTTTFTTPPPTTTSTTTTSTTSTSTTTTTSTTSTTTSTTSTTSTTTSTTSSTTTTTTTEAPTTTTSTTTTTTTTEAPTTTTSTTTTTTTTVGTLDVQFAVSFTNPDLIGTIVTAADVNIHNFDFSPDLGNGNQKGELIDMAPNYTITLYVDTSGAGNPTYADSNIHIKIKDSIIGGTAIEVSPPGITAPGEITFVSSSLDMVYNKIVLTEA